MTKPDRKTALVMMRVAGYHDDTSTFTKLYIESRISRAIANNEYMRGKDMKLAGIPCTCRSCNQTV